MSEFMDMTELDEHHWIIKTNKNARDFVKMCRELNLEKKSKKKIIKTEKKTKDNLIINK